MAPGKKYGEESVAVQSHLKINQDVISRMASNSSSCKAWCITLVSAVLVIVANKGKPNYALIAAIPTILFLTLDAYYLALEKCFRASYNSFITKLHSEEVDSTDLFAVTPHGSVVRALCCSLLSFSIWPFYLTLGVMIAIARWIVF